jgi:hypothetical protein
MQIPDGDVLAIDLKISTNTCMTMKNSREVITFAAPEIVQSPLRLLKNIKEREWEEDLEGMIWPSSGPPNSCSKTS